MEAVVIRMARENRSWGYDRIQGALKNLGSRISKQTVGTILKRHGTSPAPARKQTVTWRECIHFHLDVLLATDFLQSAVWSWCGLVIAALLDPLRSSPRRCSGYDAASPEAVDAISPAAVSPWPC
jgi:putative transposase